MPATASPRRDELLERAYLYALEHGVADLRDVPVSVRYERMLAIAHPEHRAALAAELEEHLMNGVLR